MSVIIFIISLAILILVHEFGHFIVAKKSGIRVDEFGLGFPPKIIGKKFRGTEYTLNWIPFGGFVKIFGEDPHADEITPENRSRSMYYKPRWIQALVLVAGIVMNLLFAWLLISLGFMLGLPSPVDHEGFGTVENAHVTVVETLPGSPAEKAGLQSGDQIVSVSDGHTMLTDTDVTTDSISNIISLSGSQGVILQVERGTEPLKTISLVPDTTLVPGRRVIGIDMDYIGTLQLPVGLALVQGARDTAGLTWQTAVGLWQFLKNIFILHPDFSQVAGPVGIAHTVGQAKQLGFVYLLSLVALISINLAVINLIPFPALDGGRLFFILIEVIIRRRINPKVAQWVNTVGFVLLLILMLVITGHDIFKLL